jgi:alkanesulfonate monooxygenase SsuD/methylene tetrahydromethanopterin reductase-like flavin-dependent oxidoreductase (luciferase family)
MRLAARHAATWVTIGDVAHDGPPLPAEAGAAAVARQIRLLEQACHDEGRDPAGIDRLVLTGTILAPGLDSPEEFATTTAAYGDAGVTDLVVHWPRPSEPYAGDPATFEAVVAASTLG